MNSVLGEVISTCASYAPKPSSSSPADRHSTPADTIVEPSEEVALVDVEMPSPQETPSPEEMQSPQERFTSALNASQVHDLLLFLLPKFKNSFLLVMTKIQPRIRERSV